MKTITISIPDDLFSELRNAGTLRQLSGGGLLDSFATRLLKLMDEGVTEHTFALRKRD
jgi:hypothetical protein